MQHWFLSMPWTFCKGTTRWKANGAIECKTFVVFVVFRMVFFGGDKDQ